MAFQAPGTIDTPDLPEVTPDIPATRRALERGGPEMRTLLERIRCACRGVGEFESTGNRSGWELLDAVDEMVHAVLAPKSGDTVLPSIAANGNRAEPAQERVSLSISLDLECFDTRRLHDAALAKLIEDGVDANDAASTIGTAASPNVEACVVMLLDPGNAGDFGCSVTQSSASVM